MISNFTAITATLNNIGPGLGAVGPTGNFGCYSYISKLVMIFDMLAGRLEVFRCCFYLRGIPGESFK